jgi:hypothetical protein
MSLLFVVATLLATGMVTTERYRAEAFSFTTPRTRKVAAARTTPLFVSQSNNKGNSDEKGTAQEGGGEESEEDFQRRMAVVRSLQMSFYGKDASKEETVSTTPNSSSDDTPSALVGNPPELDASTGMITRLPLFRAAWYELPGRSNVLIIKDPIYTNMFERMFYTANNSNSESNRKITPLVFGHLYTPKGTKHDEKTKKPLGGSKPQLLAWNETTESAAPDFSSPAVLGTLMYVRDYRRLKDGRILALVQGAEKFVVETVHQSLPYAIADVRVLPDVEDLGKLEERDADNNKETKSKGLKVSEESPKGNDVSFVYSCDENDEDERFFVNCLRADEGASAGPARARSVFESIHSYHHYECDSHQNLDGIPQKSDLGIADITHDAISKALPHSRFSNSTEALVWTKEMSTPRFSETDEFSLSPSVEFQLLRRGISKIPPSDRRFSYNTEPTYASATPTSTNDDDESSGPTQRPWTTEELEYELWLVLDHFSAVTNKALSPDLLALMPSEDAMTKAWPSNFRLKDVFEEYQKDNSQQVAGSSSSSSSRLYPNHRRQRRLSYSAAYLLEAILPIREGGADSDNFRGSRCVPSSSESNTGAFEVDEIQELRALLLAVPSTRQRLRAVLEHFHRWRLYQECDEFA